MVQMTTIFIDFENKQVLADKQRTYNRVDFFDNTKEWQVSYRLVDKIYHCGQGLILTGSGYSSEIDRQAKYVTKWGYIDKPKEDCTLALVRSKGDSLLVDVYECKVKNRFLFKSLYFEHQTIQGKDKWICFGSGGNYASGAYIAGKSPRESIEIASKLCKYTSFEVDVVDVE